MARKPTAESRTTGRMAIANDDSRLSVLIEKFLQRLYVASLCFVRVPLQVVSEDETECDGSSNADAEKGWNFHDRVSPRPDSTVYREGQQHRSKTGSARQDLRTHAKQRTSRVQ